MYCQTSSSVQLESGKTRMLSPGILAGVVELPQLRPLVLRIPAMLCGAEGEDALLGAALLLVAARAAEGGVEAVLVERLLERLRLHDVGVHLRAVRERVDALRQTLRVHVHEQLHAEFARHLVAKLVHVAELPRRVDVQQRKRRRRRIERLDREVQHHRAVLADGVEHHRLLALRHHLAHDVDALGLEPLQVGERRCRRRCARLAQLPPPRMAWLPQAR